MLAFGSYVRTLDLWAIGGTARYRYPLQKGIACEFGMYFTGAVSPRHKLHSTYHLEGYRA